MSIEYGPQSNQRGIETRLGATPLKHAWGLNRTSVGLKPVRAMRIARASGTPQSNQRGIETFFFPPLPSTAITPQSNQRGIETPVGGGGGERLVVASIEPAWD